MNKIEFKKLNNTERPGVKLGEVTDEQIEKDKGGYVVVARVTDWIPSSNDKLKEQGNKSFPHEGLECSMCYEPVVISNRMFEITKKNKTLKVVCIICMPFLIKKDE